MLTSLGLLMASLIKGITGFGFSLIALPILLYSYPIKTVIPVLTIGNLLSSALIILQKRGFKSIRNLKVRLSIWGAVGTVLGTLILKQISGNTLTLVIAGLFFGLSILYLTGIQIPVRRVQRASIKTGFISGLLAGSISLSGPPLTLFLNAIKVNKAEFRYLFAWFSVVTGFIALIAFALAGIITPDVFSISALVFPILLLGSWFGKRIAFKLSSRTFYWLTIAICILSSSLLFIQSIHAG